MRRSPHSGGSPSNWKDSDRTATRNGVDMDLLVGRPHLFARLRDLRDGFMVEPIAVMTLQPDGRITGHGHPNEGSWIPYGFGPVPVDRAFAFVTANNDWIPSSTWTQSLGDVPVGFFCDEPEASSAAQKLCLIPNDVGGQALQIKYLVASCAGPSGAKRWITSILARLAYAVRSRRSSSTSSSTRTARHHDRCRVRGLLNERRSWRCRTGRRGGRGESLQDDQSRGRAESPRSY
jgi:hypothetical protein